VILDAVKNPVDAIESGIIRYVVHRDTDPYDLTIKAGARTAVIDTTSNHLFRAPGATGRSGRWVKAPR
jgi:hypothetical protein